MAELDQPFDVALTSIKTLVPTSERANTDAAVTTAGDVTATAVAGTYKYTFATDLAAVNTFKYYGATGAPDGAGVAITNVGPLTSAAATATIPTLDLAWDTADTYRVVVVSRDGTNYLYNAAVDFVPASLPAVLSNKANQVVTNESCGACHGDSENRTRDPQVPRRPSLRDRSLRDVPQRRLLRGQRVHGHRLGEQHQLQGTDPQVAHRQHDLLLWSLRWFPVSAGNLELPYVP